MVETEMDSARMNSAEAPEGVLHELRSGKYNINPITAGYNGGERAGASGATVPDRETAMRMLSDPDAWQHSHKSGGSHSV